MPFLNVTLTSIPFFIGIVGDKWPKSISSKIGTFNTKSNIPEIVVSKESPVTLSNTRPTIKEIPVTPVLKNLFGDKNILTPHAITKDEKIVTIIEIINENELEKVTNFTKQEAISTGYILGQDGKYQKVTSSTDFDTVTEIYVPKINAFVAKVDSIDEIPQSYLDFAQQHNLPIYLLGK